MRISPLKALTSVMLILSVISCAHKPLPISYNCPKMVLPPDPVPQTKRLTKNSRPDQVIKAWVATANEYRGWNKIVREQVENS
jgi:hypothetical protein